MCYHWTFRVEYEKVGLWLFIIHSLMASGLKKMYHESILLFHRIKVIHACFYRILSRFQLYSPHSLSLTKFPSPPGSRDLPLGRLGPTLGDRGGARLLPQLPGEVSPAPALPSVVWVSAPCGAGSRLPGGRPGQAGRQGGPAVGVRPGPCAPLVGSHPAAAASRSLPGERWRLPRRLRLGRRARGRAPGAGGDSAMRPGRSLLSPESRAAGPRPGRAAPVGVAARRGTGAPRGPFCPRAPPGQLSASRKGPGAGVRRVTPPRCFPLARRCGPHGRTRTCPVSAASPMDPDSPDSRSCVLSPQRDHGPPVLLPKGRPEALPCQPGGTGVPLPSRRCGCSQAATVPGDGLRTQPAGFLRVGLHLCEGRPATLLFSSGSEVGRMVSVWRRCFAGVRHGYICVRITKPTDWRLLWRGRPDGPTVVGDPCY